MMARLRLDPRVSFACWLLAVLAPSTNGLIFSGLPLDTWPEWAGLIVLLPLAVRRTLAHRLDLSLGGGARSPWLAVAALVALGLKLCLGLLYGHQGFSACYSSLNAAPVGKCEASFSYPFSGGRYTRYDSTIEYGRRAHRDWPLAFLNSIRLIPREPTSAARELEPFAVEFEGKTLVREPARIHVECSGSCAVSLNLGPWATGHSSTAHRVIDVQTTAGLQHIRIRYHAPSSLGEPLSDSTGSVTEPALRVLLVDRHGSARPLRATQPPWFARGLGLLLDLGMGLLLCTILIMAVRGSAFPPLAVVWIHVLAAFAIAHRWLGSAALVSARDYLIWATGPLGLTLLHGPSWRIAWRCWLWGLTIGALRATALLGPRTDSFWLRSIGNDPLTYESFARDILATWSFQGGEPVFYYQPLFRYIRFLERLFFGDGEALVIAFAFGMLHVALFAFIAQTFRRIRARGRGRGWGYAYASLTAVLVMAFAASTLEMFTWPASEYPTWIMLPAALAAFRSYTLMGWAWGGLLLGFSTITRVNQLPGQVLVLVSRRLAAGLPSYRLRVVAAAAFVVVLLLPLAHNVAFGRQVVMFTTSGTIPENLVLRPERLSTIREDPDTRATLLRQIQALLYRVPHEGRSLLQVVSYHGLLAVWLMAVVHSVVAYLRRRSSLGPVLAFASPAAFMAVHIFYQVTVYYPRHIVVGYLAMGLLTLDELTLRADRNRAPCGGRK